MWHSTRGLPQSTNLWTGRIIEGSISYSNRKFETVLRPIEDIWSNCVLDGKACLFLDKKGYQLSEELVGVGDGEQVEFQIRKNASR